MSTMTVTVLIMMTRNYRTIFTVTFGILIYDVLLLLFHKISMKITGNIYTKPVTNIYLLNNT